MAPVLLVLVRLLQGFSAGGEVGGSATFIAESTPPHLKATYGAFTPLGSTGGFALAALVAGAMTAMTTKAQMADWGWRVPFLLAFPLTLLCLWARTRVKETHKIKSPEQQSAMMLHRVRLILNRQRTQLSNAMRAHLAEFGIAAPIGRNGIEQLLDVIADPTDERVPADARFCLEMLAAQLRIVKEQILENDRRILASARETELGRRGFGQLPGLL